MSLWAKSLLRGSVAPSYLRATEPLSCIIASKNTPKYLIKPEALCSNSLHKPLVSRDQGVKLGSQQQRQYTGSRKTWGCPMSSPSMGGLPIMSLEDLFCTGNWVLLCCFGQYPLMWVLTCKLPLKCQGKSTLRILPWQLPKDDTIKLLATTHSCNGIVPGAPGKVSRRYNLHRQWYNYPQNCATDTSFRSLAWNARHNFFWRAESFSGLLNRPGNKKYIFTS